MIHYTLLPETEIKILRREYRTRLFVVLSLFLSSSLLIGLAFLVPSYFLLRSEEFRVLSQVEKFKKERIEKGIDKIDNELISIQNTIDRSLKSKTYISSYSSLDKILSKRNSGIYIDSFSFSYDGDDNINASMQGRSSNRESLILFKKNLESEASIKELELPISDLAKSKNIPFSIKFKLIQ